MKSLFKLCLPVLATALLASCGGGGGNDGHGAFTPANGGKIVLKAQTQELPLQIPPGTPQIGGAYTSEVAISVRRHDGKLASDVEELDVTVDPNAVATFSTPFGEVTTDPDSGPDARLASATLNVTAGTATVFITSFKESGTATLTVSVPSGQGNGAGYQSASMDFTVGNVGASTPRSIALSSSYPGVYLKSSGGRSTTLVTAKVTDAGGNYVPDSDSPNVQFEVVGDPNNGNLSGGSDRGQKVQVNTTRGIAQASFESGSVQGPVTLRVTADGADNNVSNGIDDPVAGTVDIIVSDGVLYSVEITSPVLAANLPGIQINSLPVSDDAEPADSSSVGIPANPDATLSLTVSAIAQDRQGNPVLPGTPIRFGLVDEPVWPFGDANVYTACNGATPVRGNTFKMAGCQGDPKEGGKLFTASDGQFTILPGGGPAGAAGPGDALLVFGKSTAHSNDLESAMTIGTVNSATSLTLTSKFNLNDTTGSSYDAAAHRNFIPYLVGRAMHGNIAGSSGGGAATTNDVGVAHAKLTYTVGNIGHAAAIWAQGAASSNNKDRTAADIMTLTYPGVAPATLVANPSPIPGNTTTEVKACLSGALGVPIRGAPIHFQFQLPGGSGSVDGQAGSGTMKHRTDVNGCSTGTVKTSGIPASGGDGDSGPSLIFTAAGASDSVQIKVDVAFLQANPGSVCTLAGRAGDPGATPPVPPAAPQNGTITVTAFDTSGSPVPGLVVTASCDGGITVTPQSGTTGPNGNLSFRVVAEDGKAGVCTFSGADGKTSKEVGVGGADSTWPTGGFSPSGGCPGYSP